MPKKDAYQAHGWLERFYHYMLMYTEEGRPAREYLHERGINDDTISVFKVGYAPSQSHMTFLFLNNKGYSDKQLVNDRILRRQNNGKVSSLLRNRITFPIKDDWNRPIAFGGRSIDANNKIKYLNSEDSDIFSKKDHLFGLHQAKTSLMDQEYAILLEGYFDVLKAYQHGIKNVVASLGTALTTNQALLIKGITNNVVIAYDGDLAGKENSFRSASVLDEVGCNVRIANIKKGQDPDEYISEHGGNHFLNEIICKAKDVKLTLIDYKKQNYDLSKATNRYDYADEIIKGALKGNCNNQQTLEKLESVLNISFDMLYKEMKHYIQQMEF